LCSRRPDHVQLPLERVLVYAFVRFQKELPDARHDAPGEPPDLRRVHRHVPEAQEALPLLLGDAPQLLLAHRAFALVPLEEDAHPVAALWGQLEAQRLALAAEKGVRDLGEDARSVAGFGVAPARAAVLEVYRISNPSSTVCRVRRPSTRATNPSPHASCSYAGS
jgi:hypothetical protein